MTGSASVVLQFESHVSNGSSNNSLCHLYLGHMSEKGLEVAWFYWKSRVPLTNMTSSREDWQLAACVNDELERSLEVASTTTYEVHDELVREATRQGENFRNFDGVTTYCYLLIG